MRTLFPPKSPSKKTASDSDTNNEPSSFLNESLELYDDNSSQSPTSSTQKMEADSTTYESPPLPPSIDPNELFTGKFKVQPSISDLFLNGDPGQDLEPENEEDNEEDKDCCCIRSFF